MMRHLLWIFLCIMGASGCSQRPRNVSSSTKNAQMARVEVTQFLPLDASQQVLPLKTGQKMSQFVSFDMPVNAITEFFGIVKGRFNNSHTTEDATLVVHFYALPTRKEAKDGENRQLYSLFLGLYVFTGKDASIMRRVQSVDLNKFACLNDNWAHDSDSIDSVDLMWIDAKQHQIPMLKIKMSGTVISGVAGCYGLVIFPQGIGNDAVLQDFGTYSAFNQDVNVFFDDKDQRGFLRVLQQTIDLETDFVKMKTTKKPAVNQYFDWNGSNFTARKSEKPVSNSR